MAFQANKEISKCFPIAASFRVHLKFPAPSSFQFRCCGGRGGRGYECLAPFQHPHPKLLNLKTKLQKLRVLQERIQVRSARHNQTAEPKQVILFIAILRISVYIANVTYGEQGARDTVYRIDELVMDIVFEPGGLDFVRKDIG